METHELKYGRVHVRAGGKDDGPWRLDVYEPKDGGRTVVERCMAAGPEDTTAPHNKMNYGLSQLEREQGHGYNPECSCCWLNVHHTRARHDANIGSKK